MADDPVVHRSGVDLLLEVDVLFLELGAKNLEFADGGFQLRSCPVSIFLSLSLFGDIRAHTEHPFNLAIPITKKHITPHDVLETAIARNGGDLDLKGRITGHGPVKRLPAILPTIRGDKAPVLSVLNLPGAVTQNPAEVRVNLDDPPLGINTHC